MAKKQPNHIATIAAHEGASHQLAVTLVSSVIDQWARGFSDDESLQAAFRCYKGLFDLHTGTITPEAMLRTMRKKAGQAARQNEAQRLVHEALVRRLGEEGAKAIEEQAKAVRVEELDAVAEDILTSFEEIEGDVSAWNDMPTIAQWSALLRTYRGLSFSIKRYGDWYARSSTPQNERLFTQALEAFDFMPVVIEKFAEEQEAVLDGLRKDGVNVPEYTRLEAAA